MTSVSLDGRAYGEITWVDDRPEREKILEEAIGYVTRDRNREYDEPENNFAMIAMVLNSLYRYKLAEDQSFEPHDVATIASAIKLARIMANPSKRDNWVDLAGYAACGGEVAPRP